MSSSLLLKRRIPSLIARTITTTAPIQSGAWYGGKELVHHPAPAPVLKKSIENSKKTDKVKRNSKLSWPEEVKLIKPRTPRKCHVCDQEGHLAKDCPASKNEGLPSATLEDVKKELEGASSHP